MGVSRIVALEIYGNQDDVICGCAGKDEDGHLVGIISRGPQHNYKLLISAGFTIKSNEYVKRYMKNLRDALIAYVEKELADPESETSRLLQQDEVQAAMEIARMAKKGIEGIE